MKDKELADFLRELSGSVDDVRRRLTDLERRVVSIEGSTAAPVTTPAEPTPSAPPPLPLPAHAEPLAEPQPMAAAQAETFEPAQASREDILQQLAECQPPAVAASAPETPVMLPQAQPSESPAMPVLPPAPLEPQATPPAVAPAKKPAATKKPLNIEQIIGTKWLLIAGVAMLLIAGVYFFKLAYEWKLITPMRRLVFGAAFGLLMIGGGQWSLRRGMRLFAAGLIGVGMVWLYQVVYVASPSGLFDDYKVSGLTSVHAFGLMCVVTILGMILSIQTRMLTTAVISLIGAIATPILLSTEVDREVLLMCYLLAVDVGFLILALMRRWQALAPLTLAGTAVLFAGWYSSHYADQAFAVTTAFAWALIGVHVAYSLIGQRLQRAHRAMPTIILSVAGVLMAIFLLASCSQPEHSLAFSMQLIILAGGLYAYGLFRVGGAYQFAALLIAETVLWAWFQRFQAQAGMGPLTAVSWFLTALPMAAVLLRKPAQRSDYAIAQWVLVGGFMAAFICTSCSQPTQANGFVIQLMILSGYMYALGLWRGGQIFTLLVLLISEILLWLWFLRFMNPGLIGPLSVGAWLLAALPLVSVLTDHSRTRRETDIAQWFVVGSSMAAGWCMLGGQCSTAFILSQLLVLDVIVLGLALWRRWHLIRIAPLVWTAILLFVQQAYFPTQGRDASAQAWFTCGWMWAFFALLLGDIVIRSLRESIKSPEPLDIALLTVAAGGMAVGWAALGGQCSTAFILSQLLVLDVIVLGLALWRKWHLIRIAPLIWTALLLFVQQAFFPTQGRDAVAQAWFTSGWLWVFFALQLGDIVIRSWRPSLESPEALDAGLLSAAAGGMFAGTYIMLSPHYESAMGAYTTALSAGLLAMVWALHVKAGRKVLAGTMLVLAVVLLALAAPIQFNASAITVAWMLEGAAAMIAALWLGNRILLISSPVLLGLSMARFLMRDLLGDAWLLGPGLTIGGLDLPRVLLLGVGLVAAFLFCAALVRGWKRQTLMPEPQAIYLAACLTWVGAGCFALVTLLHLPAVATTWWWLILSVGFAAVGVQNQSRWLVRLATILLTAGVVKWMIFDVLVLRSGASTEDILPVLNWKFVAGAAMTAALLWLLRSLRTRDMQPAAMIGTLLLVLACVLVGWGGTFEIERLLNRATNVSWDIGQAIQMSWSIWWGLYATVLLVLGFVLKSPTARYISITLYAITAGKVMLVDLAHIHMAYKVLSLMGLGLLLLGGSLLYHRQFRQQTNRTGTDTQDAQDDN